MSSARGLGIARVALTLQLVAAPEKLDALLGEDEKSLSTVLADRVDMWVREQRLGYYPALDFLAEQGAVSREEYEAMRALAAAIRKRVKRDVQTRLWAVFSSVHIERAQSLAFMLPHFTAARADAKEALARHYFPNSVRLEVVLSSLDKLGRLEEVAAITEQKVMRNLRDDFESVVVSAVRRLDE